MRIHIATRSQSIATLIGFPTYRFQTEETVPSGCLYFLPRIISPSAVFCLVLCCSCIAALSLSLSLYCTDINNSSDNK